MTLFRLFWFVLIGSLAFSPSASSQQVAITIDDLPSHGTLPPGMTRADVARSLLKTLKDAHAPKVYGFVNARKLEQHPEDIEVLRLWRAAGFPLGNHTFVHLGIGSATAEQFDQNIALDEPFLKSLMGRHDWRWFRYPYLSEGDTLEKRRAVRLYLHDHKYRIAQVTLDFEDYLWNAPYARCAQKNDPAAIDWLKASYMLTAEEYIGLGQAAAKLLYGRDIRHVLLLHIGGFETVMLPQLLDHLKRNGFKFITLPDAEKDPAYKSDPDLPMQDGGTLLDQMLDAKHLQLPPYADKPLNQLNSICR
ncbi:MAG TPA: polysaccharide deacetylase family protein [Candidatus Acidoferrum sp.]|nr:polysaccharide deacetylase family protein [Candidatus Acidoferrum sp.]